MRDMLTGIMAKPEGLSARARLREEEIPSLEMVLPFLREHNPCVPTLSQANLEELKAQLPAAPEPATLDLLSVSIVTDHVCGNVAPVNGKGHLLSVSIVTVHDLSYKDQNHQTILQRFFLKNLLNQMTWLTSH